eukprot:gene7533-biopygen4581
MESYIHLWDSILGTSENRRGGLVKDTAAGHPQTLPEAGAEQGGVEELRLRVERERVPRDVACADALLESSQLRRGRAVDLRRRRGPEDVDLARVAVSVLEPG